MARFGMDVFVVADSTLAEVAQAEGLTILNPDTTSSLLSFAVGAEPQPGHRGRCRGERLGRGVPSLLQLTAVVTVLDRPVTGSVTVITSGTALLPRLSHSLKPCFASHGAMDEHVAQ